MTKSSSGRTNRRNARKSTGAKSKNLGQRLQSFGTTPKPKIGIPVGNLGFPGSLKEIHVVPQFPDATRTDQDRLEDDTEREFEVSALLSKAPNPPAILNFAYSEVDGESYFTFAPQRLAIDTPWGTVTVRKNTNGEASMVTMTCLARSCNDALDRLQLACATFLDHWAYEATAPVYMGQLRACDLANKNEMLRVTAPFRLTQIDLSETKVPTPLRPVLALYREGLGSSSSIYKFLCFYKILEGYSNNLKTKLAKLLKSARLEYPRKFDYVPNHSELDPVFADYIDKSISDFRDKLLRPDFRVAVAHFEKDGLNPLVMSNPEEIIRFNRVAMAAELCARTVIETYCLAFHAAEEAGLDLQSLL